MEMPLGDAAAGPQEKCEIIQHLGQQRCVGPPFCQTRYYMLIVIGDISTDHQLDSVKEHIKQGILSWDIDLTVCDLNKELKLFEARHSAQFSSEVKAHRVASSTSPCSLTGGSHCCSVLYRNHFHCFSQQWKMMDEDWACSVQLLCHSCSCAQNTD
ncbi:hypothetical protein H4Q32_001267 [Labeo rohita]|uniref:Microtubule-associated protein 1B/S N-terminal domain-containing protein n=1 Tax=Labeo rohita TaxID=84645 RepID=A0ABQ8MHS7_LABRO|nr:hypothetical protein H4Q32_001267 [Labeo rohita]